MGNILNIGPNNEHLQPWLVREVVGECGGCSPLFHTSGWFRCFLLKLTFTFITHWLHRVTSCHRCSLTLSTTPSCLCAQVLVWCVDTFQPLSFLSMPYSCGQVGTVHVCLSFSTELKHKQPTITHFELFLLIKIVPWLTFIYFRCFLPLRPLRFCHPSSPKTFFSDGDAHPYSHLTGSALSAGDQWRQRVHQSECQPLLPPHCKLDTAVQGP